MVYRFVVERRGQIQRLVPDSAEAEEVRRRLGPRPDEGNSEASGSFVDRMLAAVNKNNATFQPPQSESLAASQTTLGEQTEDRAVPPREVVVDPKSSSNPQSSDDINTESDSCPTKRRSIKRPRSVTPPPSLKSNRSSVARTPSPTLKKKFRRSAGDKSQFSDGLSLTSRSTLRSRSESPTTSTPLKYSLRAQTPPALKNPLKQRRVTESPKKEENTPGSLS